MSALRTARDVHGIQPANTVVVIDNAPSHARAEEYVESAADLAGVTVLRLAPYSCVLNPIELLWSAVKARVKNHYAATFEQMVQEPPAGVSKVEHRLRYVEGAIDLGMLEATMQKCLAWNNHVVQHYQLCLTEADLPIGV